MKNLPKKLAIGVMTLSIAFTTIACSNPKHEAIEIPKDQTESIQDTNYTEDLKKEDIVEDGQVYIEDGIVIGVMVIKKDADEEEAKDLAEKYAKDLKATYKDKKVNVQAVKDG